MRIDHGIALPLTNSMLIGHDLGENGAPSARDEYEYSYRKLTLGGLCQLESCVMVVSVGVKVLDLALESRGLDVI